MVVFGHLERKSFFPMWSPREPASLVAQSRGTSSLLQAVTLARSLSQHRGESTLPLILVIGCKQRLTGACWLRLGDAMGSQAWQACKKSSEWSHAQAWEQSWRERLGLGLGC